MKIGLVTEATCMYFFFDFGANTLAVVASFFFFKKKGPSCGSFFLKGNSSCGSLSVRARML
jgi:uncharacterized protein YbbK (DUF523 family)